MTAATAGSLVSLHRYPVKSMMGEEINAAQVTPRGLYGDRAYALCDSETRRVVSAKNPRKWPNMFQYRAAYVIPPESEPSLPAVRVMLPDGRMVRSTSPEFAPALSAALGRQVQLVSVPPPKAELEEYWPDMDGLAHRDLVTDEAMPEGTFFDLAVLHILTTGTINSLRSMYPIGRFEPRRFRPNLIIDTGDAKGFPENDWIGKTLSIGPEVKIQVTGPCARCVMTTLAQGDLPRDPGILKTAAQHNQVRVGIYASVIESGMVHVGDTVTLTGRVALAAVTAILEKEAGMKEAFLRSIQVGKPESYGYEGATDTHDKPWTTGFFKNRVTGPVFVGFTNLAGDGQADLKHHGGIDKAVLAYSADNYLQWRQEVLKELPFGAFGENLTITGLNEENVHIGDVFAIGPVTFEVSQPRQPCWKLARRWRMNELVGMVINNGRSGWYLRVLREGTVEAGMGVTLVERRNPDWPIARANRVLHHHKTDLDLTLALAAVPHLAASWVDELMERAERLRMPAAV